MAVRPPIGMVVSPGSVRSIEKAPPVPTMRSPSKAAMLRSYSNQRSWSASSSGVNVSPKTVAMTSLNWSPCSGVMGRMSMSMGSVVLETPAAHTWFSTPDRTVQVNGARTERVVE